MKLAGRDVLKKFKSNHPDAKEPLDAWEALIKRATPRHYHDLRDFFGPVDPVKKFTIFNIKGNTYRLETKVNYKTQLCRVTWIGTHSEYDKRKY